MSAVTQKDTSASSSFLDSFYGQKPSGSFASIKEEAAKLLNQRGLPSIKDEEYKFTPITKKIEGSISRFDHAMPFTVNPTDLEKYMVEGLEAYLIVLNNGFYDKNLSTAIPKGVKVIPFKELGDDAKKIAQIVPAEKDPYAVLNQLAFQDGILISVEDKIVLDKPVYILQLARPDQSGQTIHPRIYIETGKFVEATFIEQTISLDEEAILINSVEEIKVGEGAHVHHYKIQDESKQTLEVSNTGVDVPKNATFTSFVLSLQCQMIRNNLSINLLDSNCEGNMYGIYLLNGKTHVDNHTNVDHTKPHAESNELYKGILSDSSRGVFNGKIFVRQDAQKTNAFQQNNNILLSEDAIVNTKPQLEIWADDVKCSHGCTTGQLDEEALFYLRARGISKENARALLLYAFAGEVLEKIENESFRSYCIQLVQRRLGNKGG